MKGWIFTNLVTYGGAAIGVVRPFYGLLAYVCLAVVRPWALWPWAVQPGRNSLYVAIGFLTGWILHGFGNWRFGHAKLVVFLLAFYWAWTVACAIFAPDQALAWDFAERQYKILLPVLVGITLIDSIEKLKQLAWVMVLSHGYLAFEFNQMFYSGFFDPASFRYGSIDNNGVSIQAATVVGMAFFLGIAERQWWKKLVAFGCAALIAHVPLFAMSRGGMLGLGAVGAVSFVLLPKTPKTLAVFFAGFVVMVGLAGPPVIEEFKTVFSEDEERDKSASNRLVYWGYCVEIMVDKPIFGAGPANYRQEATRRHPEQLRPGRRLLQYAHSAWFETAAELGVPGIGSLLLFYGSTCWLLYIKILRKREYKDSYLRCIACMTVSSLAGFCASASFVSATLLESPFYVALLGAGALRVASQAEITTELTE